MKKKNFSLRQGMVRAISMAFFCFGIPAGLAGCNEKAAEEVLVSVEEKEDPEKIEETDWREITKTAEGSAKQMVESGGYLFFFYQDAIYQIQEKTGEKKCLKRFEQEESSGVFWVYQGGLYFDSRREMLARPEEEGAQGACGLYRLDLATGTEVYLTELQTMPSALYASEDTLYVKGFDNQSLVYRLDPDGQIQEALSPEETVYGVVPEGCTEVFSGILPYYAEHCGYLPLQNADCLVLADTEGGTLREITEISNTSAVLFARDCFFALFRDGDGQTQCWRYEADTLDKTLIFELETNPDLLQFTEEMLYYAESRTPNQIGSELDIYQISAKEKQAGSTPKRVFSIKEEAGLIGSCRNYGNFYVTADAVYGQQFQDSGIYMGKAEKDGSPIRLLEPELFLSPLKELGHVEGRTREISCPCGAVTAAQLYLEKMVFDGEGEAVSRMNQVMEDIQTQEEKESEEVVSYMEEEEMHWLAGQKSPYSKTCIISGQDAMTYLDESYVCIRMDGYEYSGGAHGFPFRTYVVFDRKTGERLTLADLVANPVEELQHLVSSAFRALAEETSFSFESPEDLEFTVADSISYDSDFYLTDQGIAFYYVPYAIAPYAAGFPEVVIPYEKLDCSIRPETRD